MGAIHYEDTHPPIPVPQVRELMPFEAAQYFPDPVAQMRRAEYVSALIRFDWTYEFSDDPGVRVQGDSERAALLMKQRELDPDFKLWDRHCHPQCKGGRRYS